MPVPVRPKMLAIGHAWEALSDHVFSRDELNEEATAELSELMYRISSLMHQVDHGGPRREVPASLRGPLARGHHMFFASQLEI